MGDTPGSSLCLIVQSRSVQALRVPCSSSSVPRRNLPSNRSHHVRSFASRLLVFVLILLGRGYDFYNAHAINPDPYVLLNTVSLIAADIFARRSMIVFSQLALRLDHGSIAGLSGYGCRPP